MAIASSPYKNARDSPSRQLLYELQYLTISSQREFCARLDREEKEKEILHENLLRAAAAEHDRVRKEAELEGEKYLLQLEAELKLQEKERLREAERLRQEKAEKEIADKKREIERVKAEEAETKKKEEARKAEAAAAEQRKAKEKQDADDARKLQEIQDAENKKKQAAIAAEKQRLAQVSERQILDPSNLKVTPSSTVSQNPEVEADHARYLAIHRNLKELRKFMMAEARKNLRFKQRMGDMRRGIKASVGQLTEGKGANKIPVILTKPFVYISLINP